MVTKRTNPIESSNQPYWIVAVIFATVFFVGCGDESVKPTKSEESKSPVVSSSKTSRGLVFSPEIFEVDAKVGDETIDARFTVKNESDTQVTITKLDTSCTCLVVKATDSVLDPGESTMINAVFDIKKLFGHAEKMISVYTDQKKNRPIFLPVKVNVPPIFEIDPKNVTWELGGKSESKTFRFRTLRDKPIHVNSISSSRPDLMTAELKVIKKGREYEIVMTPKSTDDHLLGFVKIVTDLEIKAHQNQMGFFTISD